MDKNKVKIKEISLQDAKSFNTLKKQIESESQFMLYNKDENKASDLDQEAFIKRLNSKESPSSLKLAFVDDKMVGFIALMGFKIEKKSHIKEIAMGVLGAYSGQGIGSALLKTAIEREDSGKTKRLELSVIQSNISAIALYKKMGFIKEGLKMNSIYIDGEYFNEEIYAYQFNFY